MLRIATFLMGIVVHNLASGVESVQRGHANGGRRGSRLGTRLLQRKAHASIIFVESAG